MTRSIAYPGGRRKRTRSSMSSSAEIRKAQADRITAAGTAFPVSAPSQEAFRRFVMVGVCPFCGAGPYKVLAAHTRRAHATDKRELCELAGLFFSTSITDPAYSAKRSEMARRRWLETGGIPKEDIQRGHRTKRQLSSAAVALQRQKLNRVRHRNGGSAAHAKRASEASVRVKAERMEPIYQLVVTTYEQVLAEQDKAYGAVVETARRLGWPEATTLRRIERAWAQGHGSVPRPSRSTTEVRICEICNETFEVVRSRNWGAKTCGVACGRVLSGRSQRKVARTGTCKICGTEFTYQRPGTKERVLCDAKACRSELGRRTRKAPA